MAGSLVSNSSGSRGVEVVAHPALTFTKPGVYKYYCLVHPGMAGTITVLPATGASGSS